jgi:hypothetical protein
MFLRLLTLSFCLVFPLRARAADSVFPHCEEPRVKYCAAESRPYSVSECLLKHDDELSEECRQDLDRFVRFRREAMSSFGAVNATLPPVPALSYGGRYSPSTGNAPTLLENHGSLSSPIYHGGNDTVSASLTGGDLHLGAPVALDSGYEIPQDLYRVELAAQIFHQLPEKKIWTARASIGYAGDKPFSNAADITYAFSGSYGFPGGSDKSYWLLSVFLANNSLIADFIPLPGFAYIYHTTDFSGVFGFPIVSLQWTPVFPWSYSLAIFGPIVVSEVAYGTIDRFQAYLGFYLTRYRYLPSNRIDPESRLTVKESKAAVGFRVPFAEVFVGELQLGRAFGRKAFLGEGISDTSGGSLSLDSAWYVDWELKARFL